MPGQIRPNPLLPQQSNGVPMAAKPVQLPGRGMPPKVEKPDAMMPQAPAAAAGALDQQPGLPDQIMQKNKGLREQFDKLKASDTLLGKVASGLLDLAELGDTITPEDVTGKASSFVAAGLSAKAVASILATMPLKSQEALASWVGQYGLQVTQRRQEVESQMSVIGHELAKSGLQLLMVSDAQGKMQSGQLKPTPTGQVLVPPGNAAGPSPNTAPPATQQ